jgi:hypothetical protein
LDAEGISDRVEHGGEAVGIRRRIAYDVREVLRVTGRRE